MDIAGYVIVALNVVLGLGCGWFLARLLPLPADKQVRRLHLFLVLLAAYLAECAAFAAGMATNILSILLALLWGLVLGLWLRRSTASEREQMKAARWLAVYSSLPAASFVSVPVVCASGGWPILSTEAGARFGIPGFVPWPLNTILGFCVAVAAVAIVVKIFLTTAIARFLIRRGRQQASAVK